MSTIYLSENANEILQSYLLSKGHELILVGDTGLVYPEVASHADIYMCKLGGQPTSPLVSILNQNQQELGYKYPENIKYNGVCMGPYFIHNLKHTSTLLLDKIKELHMYPIHVNQGYTKCNMVVLNDNAAITADQGICRSIAEFFENQKLSAQLPQLHVKLITPGHVQLKGFPYGFLGGASGRVADEIIFNGNLESHPDFEKISDFIQQQNLTLKYFKEYPLTDIGSIIEDGTSPGGSKLTVKHERKFTVKKEGNL